jgi:hypothetical protein
METSTENITLGGSKFMAKPVQVSVKGEPSSQLEVTDEEF